MRRSNREGSKKRNRRVIDGDLQSSTKKAAKGHSKEDSLRNVLRVLQSRKKRNPFRVKIHRLKNSQLNHLSNSLVSHRNSSKKSSDRSSSRKSKSHKNHCHPRNRSNPKNQKGRITPDSIHPPQKSKRNY